MNNLACVNENWLDPELILKNIPLCLLNDARFEFPVSAEYEEVIGPLESLEIQTGIVMQFINQVTHHLKFQGAVNNLGLVTKNKFFPIAMMNHFTVSIKNFSTQAVLIKPGMPLGKLIIEPN